MVDAPSPSPLRTLIIIIGYLRNVLVIRSLHLKGMRLGIVKQLCRVFPVLEILQDFDDRIGEDDTIASGSIPLPKSVYALDNVITEFEHQTLTSRISTT